MPTTKGTRPVLFQPGRGSALAFICSLRAQLRAMAAPMKTNRPPTIGEMIIAYTIVVICLAAPIGILWWLIPDKYEYSFWYHVDSDNVVIEEQPHNCDWERAPLGDKGCHYKKVVTRQRNDGHKVTGIYISWERVQD
jgi:hypothetical protein